MNDPNRLDRLAKLRFLVVTGKGGVGKSTIAATLALRFSSQGKRVLLCMCNSKEYVSSFFGKASLTPDISKLGLNLWAVNMNPERSIEEYGSLVLHSRALYKFLFDNKFARAFFAAVPGVHVWSMLGKAWWHTTEKLDSDPDPPTSASAVYRGYSGPNTPDVSNAVSQTGPGHWKYDIVILDAPATGHGVDMLRVPETITQVIPSGLLRRDAELARNFFRDPTRSGVILVTLPEPLPVTETLELAHTLKADLKLPISLVVLNQVLPTLFSEDENKALRSNEWRDPALPAYFHYGIKRVHKEYMQHESIRHLHSELSTDHLSLPFLADAASLEAIKKLATFF